MAVPCSTYFPLCTAEGNGVADCKKKCQNKRGFRNQVTGGNDPIGPVANPLGCTMSSAENFNSSATQEDGSCMWLTRQNGAWVAMGCDGWTPDLGYVDYEYGSDFIAVNQCALVNYGCLDPSADNYNPSADQDWTMGGTTLCVYGGSVGTLTGTKDPKKGSRSFVGAVGDDGGKRKNCKCGIIGGPSETCCAHCQDKFAVACHSGQVFWTCAMSLESITSFSNAVCGYYGVASIEQMTSDSSNMRSATGRTPLSRASNWKNCDCGMNSRRCNMDVYASCAECCRGVSSDKMRSATGRRFTSHWGGLKMR